MTVELPCALLAASSDPDEGRATELAFVSASIVGAPTTPSAPTATVKRASAPCFRDRSRACFSARITWTTRTGVCGEESMPNSDPLDVDAITMALSKSVGTSTGPRSPSRGMHSTPIAAEPNLSTELQNAASGTKTRSTCRGSQRPLLRLNLHVESSCRLAVGWLRGHAAQSARIH